MSEAIFENIKNGLASLIIFASEPRLWFGMLFGFGVGFAFCFTTYYTPTHLEYIDNIKSMHEDLDVLRKQEIKRLETLGDLRESELNRYITKMQNFEARFNEITSGVRTEINSLNHSGIFYILISSLVVLASIVTLGIIEIGINRKAQTTLELISQSQSVKKFMLENTDTKELIDGDFKDM